MSVVMQFDHNFKVSNESSTNGSCYVIIDGFIGSDNVSDSYKIFNLVLFILFGIYATGTYFWMWKRRSAPLLRKRSDFGLIFISMIGGILHYTVLIREYYGRDQVSCLVTLWISIIAAPLIIAPAMVRLIIFRNKAVFYQHMKTIAFDVYLASKDQKNLRNLKLAVTNPKSFLLAIQALNIQQFVPIGVGARFSVAKNSSRPQSLSLTPELKKQAEFGRGTLAAVSVESVNTGYYTSSAFATILLLLFLLPFAAYGALIMIITPFYQSFECVGCELTLLDLILPGIGFITTLLVVAGISQTIYGAPDPFSISKELLSILIVFAILGSIGAIFLIVDPGEYGRQGIITWHYIVCIMVFIVQTIQCLIPTMRTYRAIPFLSGESSGEMSLRALLSDPTGIVLFQEHMANEFNVESLRFYLEAEKWKESYDTEDPAKVCNRAYEIFRTFIERGSYMECNISDEVRRAMEKEVSWVQANGWKSVPKTLFDGPVSEIWRLMSMDSLPRFLKSKIYKEWTDSAVPRDSLASRSGLQKKNSRFDMFVSGIVTPPASGAKASEKNANKKGIIASKFAKSAGSYVKMNDEENKEKEDTFDAPIKDQPKNLETDMTKIKKDLRSESEPIF